MKLSVLLFGICADLINSASLEFELNQGATVGDFKQQFKESYPQVVHLNTYAIALNESYAKDAEPLKEGDVVAIIPPVSGG